MKSPYLQVITPPADLPVTIDGVFMHIQEYDHRDEALLNVYIDAATRFVEDHCRICLMPQVLEERMDTWPEDGAWELRKYPLIDIVSIKYIDADGIEQTLNSSMYDASIRWEMPYIYLHDSVSISHKAVPDAIKVQYTAGHAVPGSIDSRIIHAIMLIARESYDHRMDADAGPGFNELVTRTSINLLSKIKRHAQ